MAGTIDSGDDRPRGSPAPPGAALAIVVAARDEAERIAATLTALTLAFPGATLWVADDGSRDATVRLARAAGATVLGDGRRLGKGGAMTAAVDHVLRAGAPTLLLCDGDLASSAARLTPLVAAVRDGGADLAVAAFARPRGGGFGLALSVARFLIDRLCGFRASAPLSGQRALRRAALEDVLPFAPGFGMEVGMTIDAVRAGRAVVELELDLAHRPSGRTPVGFAHRGRQLLDVVRAAAARR